MTCGGNRNLGGESLAILRKMIALLHSFSLVCGSLREQGESWRGYYSAGNLFSKLNRHSTKFYDIPATNQQKIKKQQKNNQHKLDNYYSTFPRFFPRLVPPMQSSILGPAVIFFFSFSPLHCWDGPFLFCALTMK